MYLEKKYDIEFAIDKETDECIEEGILEQLLRDNRGEVRSMLLTQYDEQAHIEYEKELSFEEGKQEGIKEGRVEGTIDTCKLLGLTKEDVKKKLVEAFALEEKEANEYLKKYWK